MLIKKQFKRANAALRDLDPMEFETVLERILFRLDFSNDDDIYGFERFIDAALLKIGEMTVDKYEFELILFSQLFIALNDESEHFILSKMSGYASHITCRTPDEWKITPFYTCMKKNLKRDHFSTILDALPTATLRSFMFVDMPQYKLSESVCLHTEQIPESEIDLFYCRLLVFLAFNDDKERIRSLNLMINAIQKTTHSKLLYSFLIDGCRSKIINILKFLSVEPQVHDTFTEILKR
ncbi:hypothetical protein PCE1_003203 [Barthelona sp. PCE]